MIIRFDRTPEELYRLSREAFGRGELERALLYGEDAVRGKGSTEYKVSRAEILLSMGRYADAADVALEALCYGAGWRAELYDVLARVSSELGHFYESLHYLAKKAHYEGDDDTLDAMDEVIEELDAEHGMRPVERDFFVVGKEEAPKRSDPTVLLRANYALNHGDLSEAIRIASSVEKGSERYVDARMICLRAYLKRKDSALAEGTAEEIIGLEPKNGFALYVLIDRFKRKEYVPLLAGVEEDGSEVYYAILAAESISDHALSMRLAKRLIEANKYVPGAYFVAAAVALNGGDKKGSESYLRTLFSFYRKYPQEVVLAGWRRLGKCAVGFSGRMPVEIVRILERYVAKHAKTAEEFITSMMTDEAFRASVSLVLEDGGRKLNAKIVSFLAEGGNRQVDAFFAKALLHYDVDLILKREIFAALYFRKDKGRLFVAQSVVPVRVSCLKPPHFAEYPHSLRLAYSEAFSFLTCMTDALCESRLQKLTERISRLEGAEDLSTDVIIGAYLYRLLAEGLIPVGAEAPSEEDACRFFLHFIFGYRRTNMSRVRLLAAIIAD